MNVDYDNMYIDGNDVKDFQLQGRNAFYLLY